MPVQKGSAYYPNQVLLTDAVSGSAASISVGGGGADANANLAIAALGTGTIQLNSALSVGSGTGRATGQKSVSAPTAPASTSAYKMQGLAGAITPNATGVILLIISGTIVSPAGTAAGNGISYQLSYGTGSAPANAAALTGTQVGTIQEYTNPTTVVAADVNIPFCTAAVVTGLTVGTAYWLDLAAESVATVSDMGLANVSITAVELL